MLIQEKCVNTIKKLSLEMVNRAGSGHCGSSLDCASILYSIYSQAKISPNNPDFFNRDRVVLSCGHASAALYSVLHLCGFNILVTDLKDFRKVGSLTPGHPETTTPGVDCTTGALGEGIAYAVGLALAETMLSARFNKPRCKIVDHYTYLVCGDGDLQEGISYESFALAGKWKLNKLITIYNKNDMTIDGGLSFSSNENVKMRFLSQGFDVLECENNVEELNLAIRSAKLNKNPTIIICNTKIAKGTMYQNEAIAHSNPFTEEDIKKLNKKWQLDDEPFKVDLDVYKHFRKIENKGEAEFENWKALLRRYKTEYSKEFKLLFSNNISKIIKHLDVDFKSENLSTLQASHILLQAYAKACDNFVGGCADLAKSTKSYIEKEDFYNQRNPKGRNIAFGVRENAMAGIVSGLCLHGGMRGFASTFLAFSDYMKYGMRLSAMMNIPTLYLLTHDSILLGADGATHQPIEQLESLRLMPNIMVFRPFDATETKFSYMWYASHNVPAVIALSKSIEPINKKLFYEDFERGAYIISREKNRKLNAILIATGSEVELALRTKKLLEYRGYVVRVVSMPCRELFERQEQKFKEKIIPSNFPIKVCIEAGVTRSWESLSGEFGFSVGVNSFGESGEPDELYDLFGLSALNISNIVINLISKNKC